MIDIEKEIAALYNINCAGEMSDDGRCSCGLNNLRED